VTKGLIVCSTLDAYLGMANGGQHLGLTRVVKTSHLGPRSSAEITGIAILRGLLKTLFRGAAAHEPGHAWLKMNDVGGLAKRTEVGFCELRAFRYYMRLDTLESRYYASGYRGNSAYPRTPFKSISRTIYRLRSPKRGRPERWPTATTCWGGTPATALSSSLGGVTRRPRSFVGAGFRPWTAVPARAP